MKRRIGGRFASLKNAFKSTSALESNLAPEGGLHGNHNDFALKGTVPVIETLDSASSSRARDTQFGFENTCNHCQYHVYPFIHGAPREFGDGFMGSICIDLAPRIEQNARSRCCILCQTFFEIRWSTSGKGSYYLHAFSAAMTIYQCSVESLQLMLDNYGAGRNTKFQDSLVFAVLADESESVPADFALCYAMGAEVMIKCNDSVKTDHIVPSTLDKEHNKWLVRTLKLEKSEDRAQPATILSAIRQARSMGFIYELSYEHPCQCELQIQSVTVAELIRREETGAKHVNMAAMQPVDTGHLDAPRNIGYMPHSIRDGGLRPIQALSVSSFCGRMLEADKIDYSLVRGWLRQCQLHCHLDGLVQDLDRFREIEFKLVDVQERRIIKVEHEMHKAYVALSYVWGSSPFSVSGNETEEPDLLPRRCVAVIEDAIEVVRQLGFRYLWVDHFCISQKSESRHDQIASMDVIYKNADLTIIAAAGSDAAHGLPGVSSRARKPQYQAKVGDQHLVVSSIGSRHWDLHSTYSNRAWTYQEFCFSRRRLIFTDHQVSYNCHDRCVGPGQQESMICPPQRLFRKIKRPDQRFHDEQNDAFVNKIPANYRGAAYDRDGSIKHKLLEHIEKFPTLIAFEYHVVEFTRRKLSFDQDSLQAVISILDRFRSNKTPILHLQGLPFVPRERSHPTKKESAGDNFGLSLNYGLLWTHGANKCALRRRGAFPSWSWTGWEGEVHWLPDTTYSGLWTVRHQDYAPELVIIRTTTSGNVGARTISAAYWRPPVGDERHPVELQFDGPLFKINVHVKQATASFATGVYFSDYAQPVRLHVTSDGLEMDTLFEMGLYGLILAHDRSRDFVLVVRRVEARRLDTKRKFFERVGVMIAPHGSCRIRDTESSGILV